MPLSVAVGAQDLALAFEVGGNASPTPAASPDEIVDARVGVAVAEGNGVVEVEDSRVGLSARLAAEIGSVRLQTLDQQTLSLNDFRLRVLSVVAVPAAPRSADGLWVSHGGRIARAVGLEPTTAGFGDRCSTN